MSGLDGPNGRSKSIAEDLVDAAIASDFPPDPVVGDYSRAVSVISSVIRRHGLAIQSTIARTLAAGGRYEVLENHAVPVSRTADDLVAARNAQQDLSRIRLDADTAVARFVTVDLLVIDEQSSWIAAYDVKRGLGATESKKRKIIERDLLALRLTLPSLARQRGLPGVYTATSGIIDFYGKGGFPRQLTLTGRELDDYFDVELVAAVDRMTAEVAVALRRAVSDILTPGRTGAADRPGSAPPRPDPATTAALFDAAGCATRPISPKSCRRAGFPETRSGP